VGAGVKGREEASQGVSAHGRARRQLFLLNQFDSIRDVLAIFIARHNTRC